MKNKRVTGFSEHDFAYRGLAGFRRSAATRWRDRHVAFSGNGKIKSLEWGAEVPVSGTVYKRSPPIQRF